MTGFGWFQIFLYFLALLLVTKPMGAYLYRVFEHKRTALDFVFRPIEKLIYSVCGIDENKEMRWLEYGTVMLLFSGVSLVPYTFSNACSGGCRGIRRSSPVSLRTWRGTPRSPSQRIRTGSPTPANR